MESFAGNLSNSERCGNVVLSFKFVDKILECDVTKESSLAVLGLVVRKPINAYPRLKGTAVFISLDNALKRFLKAS